MLGQDIKTEIVLLSRDNAYLLEGFSCGNEVLDTLIKAKCPTDFSMVTKLVLNTADNSVIGVYSLSCGAMIVEDHKQHFPYSAVEISLFAISSDYQDMKFSEDKDDGCISNVIFSDILVEIFDFTDNLCGANLIYLYATPNAVSFYEKNGFEDFPELAWKNDDRFLEGCKPMLYVIRK